MSIPSDLEHHWIFIIVGGTFGKLKVVLNDNSRTSSAPDLRIGRSYMGTLKGC